MRSTLRRVSSFRSERHRPRSVASVRPIARLVAVVLLVVALAGTTSSPAPRPPRSGATDTGLPAPEGSLDLGIAARISTDEVATAADQLSHPVETAESTEPPAAKPAAPDEQAAAAPTDHHLPVSATAPADWPEPDGSDRIIVGFDLSTTRAERAAAARRAGGELVADNGSISFSAVTVPAGRRRAVEAALASSDRVRSVEPERTRQAFLIPDDPRWSEQEAAMSAAGFPAAWDVTAGSSSVVVAVVDTGVSALSDLAPNLVDGYDAIDGTSTSDPHGHGTAVASVLAARGDNGMGLAGGTWVSKIMPVRVLDASGSGQDFDIAKGITWAADRGADVINMSLGATSASAVLNTALEHASAKGAILVAASGNNPPGGADPEARAIYPAAHPYVIGVGAIDNDADLAHFSITGDFVDIVAPGIAVPVLGPRGPRSSGTSFAAPLAAAAAALVLAQHPSWDAGRVTQRMLDTAADIGPIGRDHFTGVGRLDAGAALGQPPTSVPEPDADLNGSNDLPADAGAQPYATARLETEGDLDWYRIDTPGVRRLDPVTVAPAGTEKSGGARLLQLQVRIYSPNLELILERVATEPDEEVTITSININPGSYIQVRNHWFTKSPGTYTVSVALSDAAGGATPPGDSAAFVWSTLPRPGSTDANGAAFSVTFARALDSSTVSPATIYIRTRSGRALRTSALTYDRDTHTAALKLPYPLPSGTTAMIMVLGLRDGGGRLMSEPAAIPFRVE